MSAPQLARSVWYWFSVVLFHSAVSSAAHTAGISSAVRTIVVDTANGKDTPSCGTETKRCKTIAHALMLAQNMLPAYPPSIMSLLPPGSVEVEVYPGTYLNECTEHGISVRKPVDIRAASPAGDGNVVIDCEFKGKALNFSMEANSSFSRRSITLLGLTFLHCNSNTSGGAVYFEQPGGEEEEEALLVKVEACHFEQAYSFVDANEQRVDASSAARRFTRKRKLTDPYGAAMSEGGGAICTKGTVQLIVERSSFEQCKAPSGAGGAILLTMGSTKQHTALSSSAAIFAIQLLALMVVQWGLCLRSSTIQVLLYRWRTAASCAAICGVTPQKIYFVAAHCTSHSLLYQQ
jgi:hypothetical protein